MRSSTERIIEKYCAGHSVEKDVEREVCRGVENLVETYRDGVKLLIYGNGGSSADADHIVGELMKAFRIRRTLEEDVIARLQ